MPGFRKNQTGDSTGSVNTNVDPEAAYENQEEPRWAWPNIFGTNQYTNNKELSSKVSNIYHVVLVML